MSREGVISDWAKKRDVLYGVDFDVAGKVEFVCPVGDNF